MRMLRHQYHGHYLSGMRCPKMRILPYNKSATAVGSRIGYILSWDALRPSGCLVEEDLAWSPCWAPFARLETWRVAVERNGWFSYVQTCRRPQKLRVWPVQN